MKTIDLSDFYASTESPETLAYDHALDLAYLVVEEMNRQGVSKTELASRMGVSPQRLAAMLNTQPNMTLKSIAQFELALGIRLDFSTAKTA